MHLKRFRHLPVIDEEQRLVGLVSHRDAERATGGKRMAGRHMRYTVYLSPESIGRLKEIAAARSGRMA